MARTDFSTPRLCVDAPLAEGAEVALDAEQTNYLVNVLRLGADARVLVFNGRDGEFAASLAAARARAPRSSSASAPAPQEAPPDVDYLFAPLKHARLDYMAQKAVEMGARRLRPIITRRTQVARLNLERLRANAIEACEQCGVIWTPEVARARAARRGRSPLAAPNGCSSSATRRRRRRARSTRSPTSRGAAASAC